MDSIKLKRPVAIKAIVTEKFKTEATKEIQQALQNFDLALQQLEFQGKRAMTDLDKNPDIPNKDQARAGLQNQIDQQRGQINSQKSELLQRLNMISQLEMDSEFLQATVDNFVEVKVGDNLYEKLSNTEVIVKDGVVIEIRGQE
ncbi:MAG: YlqD family protein [Candidatus Sericytochromatia bacterium]|nr:YlqD family protein [Candidatus Sericytochromatia bacterium]